MTEIASFLPPPSRPRVRSDEIWAAAREAYLDGMSATEVCERLGLGVSTFRARAAREGWRRNDQAEPPADLGWDEPIDAVGAAARPPAELAAIAWAHAGRAMARGHLAGARGWTQLTRELRAMAEGEAEEARAAVKTAAREAFIEAGVDDGLSVADAGYAFSMESRNEPPWPVYPTVARGDAVAASPDDRDGSDGRTRRIAKAPASRPWTRRARLWSGSRRRSSRTLQTVEPATRRAPPSKAARVMTTKRRSPMRRSWRGARRGAIAAGSETAHLPIGLQTLKAGDATPKRGRPTGDPSASNGWRATGADGRSRPRPGRDFPDESRARDILQARRARWLT